MKVHKLDERIYNINIRSEFFKVENSGVDKLWQLFSLYKNDRFSNNYSKESFDRLISTNRFSYGAVVTYINDQPSLFFGLSEVKNWVVVTRGVELFHFNYDLPIFLGHSLPFTIELVKSNNKTGLFMTFNKENRLLYRMCFPPTKINSIYKDHEIYVTYLKVVNSLRSLPQTVQYYNTSNMLDILVLTILI